ncbi:MAG TPA: GAF domain-containing protein [Nocardiopsis listeri]|uniref:helix-turn-helix domain-containing protein n=1 Tax=Nocardiopsis listeri TaxID=53440 RepID=UPI001D8138D9|nr:helix-turn-helix domain-containing protein [Nocardiopsis listeri]HJE57612.1 GAF domain-containing protein [Nocardiopsis listeri]
MTFPSLDTALPSGVDAREHADLLRRSHDALLAGRPTPAPLRPVIEDSWERMRGFGIDPDCGPPPRVARLDELQRQRDASPIAEVMPLIRRSLVSVADQADHIMLVTDSSGQVLWREGSHRMRSVGDRVGLVEGSFWNEGSIGTNAIGTALVVGRPVQVYSAEHFVRNLHTLTCACAPVYDPRDGRLLGAIDVTGPVSTIHPSTLALVNAVAQLAQAHLQGLHHTHLERLRSVAAPLLAGLTRPALVVDDSGWTAAAVHMEPVRRVLLPKHCESGTAWIPALGECGLEPLPGGWLIRPRPGERAGSTSVTLDLRKPGASTVTVAGPSGEWVHNLTPRHTELLLLLAVHRAGRSGAELSKDVFGADAHVVTVRAELSRIRRNLGGVIESRPYRFADEVTVRVIGSQTSVNLLPDSLAPGVRALLDRDGGHPCSTGRGETTRRPDASSCGHPG